MARAPLVVLVGRPNVGKSTLFNRITATRRAIVTAVPGTTRDVIEQAASWRGMEFRLFDTGGMFGATEDPLHQLVVEKGKQAITYADLLVLVLDGQQGVVPGDIEIVAQLRANGKPAIAVVNKIDVRKAREAAMQFYELGIEPLLEVSAEHGLPDAWPVSGARAGIGVTSSGARVASIATMASVAGGTACSLARDAAGGPAGRSVDAT